MEDEKKTRRLTIDLPVECYVRLRFLTSVLDTTMKDIIVESLNKNFESMKIGDDKKARAIEFFEESKEAGLL